MFGGLAVDLNLPEAAAPLDKSHTLASTDSCVRVTPRRSSNEFILTLDIKAGRQTTLE